MTLYTKGGKNVSVCFLTPHVIPSVSNMIPEGCTVLKDGEVLGEILGSIVFKSGSFSILRPLNWIWSPLENRSGGTGRLRVLS